MGIELYPRNRRTGRSIAIGVIIGIMIMLSGYDLGIGQYDVGGISVAEILVFTGLPWIAYGLYQFRFS